MSQLKRKNPSKVYDLLVFLVDLLIVTLVFVISINVFDFTHSMYNFFDVPIIILTFSLLLVQLNTYKGFRKKALLQNILKVFYASLLSVLLFSIIKLILITIFKETDFYPSSKILDYHLLLFFFICFIILSFLRILYRKLDAEISTDSLSETKALIYGSGIRSLEAYKLICKDKDSDNEIFAFIDSSDSMMDQSIKGIKVLDIGVLNSEFILKNHIQEIIIAKENPEHHELFDFVKTLSNLKISTKIVSKTNDFNQSKTNQNLFEIRTLEIEDLFNHETYESNSFEYNQNLEGKVVLITGAAGSIGFGLAQQLISRNLKKLILLDIAESALYEAQQDLINNITSEVIFLLGNVLDSKRMEHIFIEHQPEIVFHAAAYKHVPLMENHPLECIITNLSGTKIVADLSQKYFAEKFILISTDKAVNPISMMGASKRISELYVSGLNENEDAQTKFIVTRFGNVLGSSGSVVPLFKKQIKYGGIVSVTDLEIKRFFMTLSEACHLVLEAFAIGNGGEIFVFDMGKPIKIIDLARTMIFLNRTSKSKDIAVKIIGLRPGEKIDEELFANHENLQKSVHNKIMISKINLNKGSDLKNKVSDLIYFCQNSKDETSFDSEILNEKIRKIIPEFTSSTF